MAGRESIPQRLVEEYVAGGITGAKIAVVEVTGLILDGEVDYAIRQVRPDGRAQAVGGLL